MVRQHPQFGRERMGRVLASLPAAWDRVPEREHVAGVLGRLWVEGVDIDWEGYFAGENRGRAVALPPTCSATAAWTSGRDYRARVRDEPTSRLGTQ